MFGVRLWKMHVSLVQAEISSLQCMQYAASQISNSFQKRFLKNVHIKHFYGTFSKLSNAHYDEFCDTFT